MNAHIEKILQEVGKVIVGKEATLEKILMTVLSRGHVLLDDVPAEIIVHKHVFSFLYFYFFFGIF